MRRRLTTLRAKSGASQNGAPKQLLDEMVYREHATMVKAATAGVHVPHFDPKFSGWSNAKRPRDFAASLRRVVVSSSTTTIP